MPADLLLLVVGAAVAGLVQGLSGFAFSMVAMSFWAWGLDPKLASVMAVFGSLSGQVVAAVSTGRRFRVDAIGPYLAGGLIGIPVGVFVLPCLNPDAFKLGLGLILVIWCPLMLASSRLPAITAGGRIADGLAGAAGGFMGGIGGLTGVIPTLWSTLRGLEKEHQRAIIQSFNLVTLSVTMLVYLATGLVSKEMLPLLPVVFLALLFPVLLGIRLYSRLSQMMFRKMVLVVLMLSGVAMLMALR